MFPGIRGLRNTAAAIVVIAAFVSCSSGLDDEEPMPVDLTPEATAAATAGNQFALDLYQRLRGQEGNLFFSPSSLSIALAMNYAGSAGITKQEMAKTLHFTMPDAQLHDGMQVFQEYLAAKGGGTRVRLKLANRLWGQKSITFRKEFLDLTHSRYGAAMAPLDFVSDSAGARNAINEWAAEQTENKIIDIMSPSDLSPDTVLVLASAVYFKGEWEKKFDENATQDADFHLDANQAVPVPMMYLNNMFRVAHLDDLAMLELPYRDESVSMVVILPNKIDGLADVEAKLSAEKVDEWVSRLHRAEVRVFMPKFKTEWQLDLSKTLQSMGMSAAFTPAADFSNMSAQKPLFLDEVMHKTYVDINEEGTEAVAVARDNTVKSAGGRPFRADHPFIYLIRDAESGAILFMGRLVDPRA